MKKFIALAAAALLVMPVAGKDKDKEKKADKDSLIFTTIVENPVTSIKNQNSSGTCWAYSSLAFLFAFILSLRCTEDFDNSEHSPIRNPPQTDPE